MKDQILRPMKATSEMSGCGSTRVLNTEQLEWAEVAQTDARHCCGRSTTFSKLEAGRIDERDPVSGPPGS
jgi:hypothetical protein